TLLELADAALAAALERLGRPACAGEIDELGALIDQRSLGWAIATSSASRRYCVAVGVVGDVISGMRRQLPGPAPTPGLPPPMSYAEYTLAAHVGGARPRGGPPFQLFLNGLLGIIRRRRVFDCLPHRVERPVALDESGPLLSVLAGQPIEAQLFLLA